MPDFSGSRSQQLTSQTIVPVPDRTVARTRVDAMRSLFTISLIVLIGLLSYGNVHAQNPGAVVLIPNDQSVGQTLPWCTAQTTGNVINIPDPAGDQPNAKNTSASVIAGQTINETIYSTTTPPAPTNSNPQLTQGAIMAAGTTLVVDPLDVINAINAARRSESVQLQSAKPPLPYLTGMVANASGQAVPIPPPPNPLPNTPTQALPSDYPTLTQDQKLVVLINLERTARGLSPFSTSTHNPTTYSVPSSSLPSPLPGNTTYVYAPDNHNTTLQDWLAKNCASGSASCYNPYGEIALSWVANNHAAVLAEFYQFKQIDELVHGNSVEGTSDSRINAIPQFTNSKGEGVDATQNPEDAVFGFLYQDSGNSWGHRHGLLGVSDSQDRHCATQIGAGFAPSANEADVQANPPFADPALAVPPPTFFYVLEFAGDETGWQPPLETNAVPIPPGATPCLLPTDACALSAGVLATGTDSTGQPIFLVTVVYPGISVWVIE
jgi:hypothetical protein